MPGRQELPATLRRSSRKAQRLWVTVHDNAVKQYCEGERAHRTAMDALKHSFEKIGDHWVQKQQKGPSDPQAALRGQPAREGRGESFGGVDYYGSTKDELMTRARKLHIAGRSTMDKAELARVIAKKQS